VLEYFYSYEEKWYKVPSALIPYLIYLLFIQSIKRSGSNLIMANCLQCGVPFLSSISNHGRKDLYCPFGCRHQRAKELSAKRSKKYRLTKKGKAKKAEINNNRSNSKKNFNQGGKGSSLNDDDRPHVFSPIIIYLKILLDSIFDKKMSLLEIYTIYEKMRSRSLDFYQKLIDNIHYG
jgi:uncharacterized Zn finger protein (UPF0148 family)